MIQQITMAADGFLTGNAASFFCKSSALFSAYQIIQQITLAAKARSCGITGSVLLAILARSARHLLLQYCRSRSVAHWPADMVRDFVRVASSQVYES